MLQKQSRLLATIVIIACLPMNASARFLQTDPIGYADQMVLYAYVANDPVNLTDPTGLYTCQNSSGEAVTCSENLNNAISTIADAAQGAPSEEARENLSEIVDFVGEADVDNGVVFVLGDTSLRPGVEADADTAADGTVTIGLSKNLVQRGSRGDGNFFNNLLGAKVSHEARHGIQGRARGNRNPLTRAETLAGEIGGSTSEAYFRSYTVSSGLEPYSSFVNPGSHTINRGRIQDAAAASTAGWCAAASYLPNSGC